MFLFNRFLDEWMFREGRDFILVGFRKSRINCFVSSLLEVVLVDEESSNRRS